MSYHIEDVTECQKKIKDLRKETGMNRKEFCERFSIPYRTVTEWERGNRSAPDYVLRFIEYYISMQKSNMLSKRNITDFVCIESKRLIIRNFQVEDAESCYNGWGQDKELRNYILGYPMDKERMFEFVTALTANKNAWVIIERESNCCVGYITVDIPYAEIGIGELGYVIGEKYQHKGYAYEAINLILNRYFIDKNMYMIEARYNQDNIPSSKLLQKLGFVVDGIIRNRRIDYLTGERRDMVICSITIEEYKEKIHYEEK